MAVAVEGKVGVLCGRCAWRGGGGGQDIELAGEVGEGVHGSEADAEEGGLEEGAEGEREKKGAGRRRRERRLVQTVDGVRLWPWARVT